MNRTPPRSRESAKWLILAALAALVFYRVRLAPMPVPWQAVGTGSSVLWIASANRSITGT